MSSNNGLAHYARHPSLDAGIRSSRTTQVRDDLDEQRPATPPIYGFATQAVTDSAKLPTPKPFASGRNQFNNTRNVYQPKPPHPLRMQPPACVRDATPQRQLRRTHSQGTDITSFWPESQIDSQFGSPTSQRSEKFDIAINDRGPSPLPAFGFPSTQVLPIGNSQRQSFTIGKNGATRPAGSNDENSLHISSSAFPPSLDPATQADGYSSEPCISSPQPRPINLALHSATVRKSYGKPLYDDDQEVFSDSPTYQVQDHFRGSSNHGASDYQISEIKKGTPRRDKTRKRRRDSCDYDDDELGRMAYTQLRDQPFDDDPALKSQMAIGPLTGDSLPAKLQHFKGQREAEQKQFFMQMTVNDWERSGDWLLEQFGYISQKLKNSRLEKRTMVEQFENEVAKREEAVRARTENINKKLSQIKHKGEDMLADKEL